jgi:CheY-like chemotaxis protein
VFHGHCDVESAPGAGEALAVTEEAAEAEASETEASAPFDLLIIDINLSGHEDGIVLLRRLREEAGAPAAGVPAVAFTAHAMPGDRERYREAGFEGYVGKPFSNEELLETAWEMISCRTEETDA